MVKEAKPGGRTFWIVGLAGACALGFALGQLCPRPADARILRPLQKNASGVDELAAQVAALGEHRRSAGTAGQLVDVNELAAKLQDVCGNGQNRAAPSRAPSPAPEAEPQEAKETQESVAAYDQARQVVDRAVRAKRWTDTDSAELRRATLRLSMDQGEEVTRTLVQAINSGELAVRTSGPPL